MTQNNDLRKRLIKILKDNVEPEGYIAGEGFVADLILKLLSSELDRAYKAGIKEGIEKYAMPETKKQINK